MKPKLSPWFNLGENPPVHIGLYEIKDAPVKKWWDGKDFLMCRDCLRSVFNRSDDEWRGRIKCLTKQ